MKVTTIGIILAKNIFQVQGVNELILAAVRKKLKCTGKTHYFANLAPPCSAWNPVAVSFLGNTFG